MVLLDEFDKANPGIWSAFYQMFDEGKFEDSLYKVDLQNCVFILTSNFSDRNEILNGVGMPIYSRIDEKIKFKNGIIRDKKYQKQKRTGNFSCSFLFDVSVFFIHNISVIS